MPTHSLIQFTLQDATNSGAALRQMGRDADCLETVATRCVNYFYQHLVDPNTGKPSCALVRFFKTHAYGQLPPNLQTYARQLAASNEEISAQTKCLTLLATTGHQGEWCDRHLSKNHQSIPLTSERAVKQIPMIAQLIHSFGLDINTVLAPDPGLLVALEQKTCNVFYIPHAAGSEHIPFQQEFVNQFGIKSVLGVGGILPSGDLFALILFATILIPEATARLFKTLPPNIKMAMIPFEKDALFMT